jgi:uncharacterized protein (TIGR02117 family)
MLRFFRWLIVSLILVPLGLAILYLVTMGRGDSSLYPVPAGEEPVAIYLADHGHHAGLIVRVADLERFAQSGDAGVLSALFARYQNYSWIEIGWGDEQFYRFAPTLSHVTVSMAFSALAGFNDKTVLHVVGLSQAPDIVFRHSDVQRVELSSRGMETVLAGIAGSFFLDDDGLPVELGKGIYGPSLFYRATGRYSVLNTCNAWLGRLLTSAGLKISPVATVTSAGLMTELRWRNDLVSQPSPIAAQAP